MRAAEGIRGPSCETAAVALHMTGCDVLCTIGALCYAPRWPEPWPSPFGYHETFHTAVTAAAICHHVTVWQTHGSPAWERRELLRGEVVQKDRAAVCCRGESAQRPAGRIAASAGAVTTK